MSCEDDCEEGRDIAPKIPRKPFDYFGATRQFERFLMAAGGGADPLGLRDYRTSWEKAIAPRPAPRASVPDPEDRIIAKMIFNPDTGEEKIIRFDEPGFDEAE